jgi:hypothetical protein
MSNGGMTVPAGAWSGERLLVVTHNAALPPFCVKCGSPTNEPPLKRQFSWHSPWYFLLILFGLLPYAIVALMASKRMVVQVPLCSKHREQYKALKLAAMLLLLGSIPEMIAAGTFLSEDYQGAGILAGFMALLAGLVCLAIYGGVLRPKYIDDNFGYFRNVDVSFLNLLPPRPQDIPQR